MKSLNRIQVVTMMLAMLVAWVSPHAFAVEAASSIAAASISADDEIALIESENPMMLNLIAERLIDPPHWQRGRETGIWPKGDQWEIPEKTYTDRKLPPYLGYGKGTFAHWKAGTIFVLRNSHRFPTIEDYKKTQAIGFYNEPGDLFWGYYGYQIEKAPEPMRAGLLKLRDQAQTEPRALEELFQHGIKNGRGQLRDEGDTCWFLKPWDVKRDGFQLFTHDEFQRVAQHKLLRFKTWSDTPEGVDARFWHPEGKDVPGLLQTLFAKTKARAEVLLASKDQIGKTAYDHAVVSLAAEFYIELVVIHGLWDGNGRTSKMMRDWLLRYMGLPVPASTPVNDLEMTRDEYVENLKLEISKTRVEMQRLQSDKMAIEVLAKTRAKRPKSFVGLRYQNSCSELFH